MTQASALAANGLKNEETGFVLTASDADLKKSLGGKFSYDERLFRAVAPVLDEVVTKARLMESSADVKHRNPDVQGVHIFATLVEIDGKLYRVQLVVRDYVTPKQERLATHKIAGIQIYEIENPPVSKADGGPSDIRGVTAPDIRLSSSPVAPSDRVISLAQLAGGRKPYVRQDGKGLFDSVDDSARASGGAYYEEQEFNQAGSRKSVGTLADPLVAAHHTSAENLLKANKLGGLAVPSIGITKADSGYSGFGDITLIGTKGLIDPAKGTPVYSADAYTNTFPAFEWGKSVDKKKAEVLQKEYRKAELSFRGGTDNTMRSLINSPDRDNFLWQFRKSVVSQKMFLDEKGRYLFA